MDDNSRNEEGAMANRLADETSPYLLQHAHNPVDWYPWGPEALERARDEDRPIMLSIGYSACHWCHVMERESFEHPGIARLMNENFVNVKVDREERPDLDSLYMAAVQGMTGHGGWPMTVFLTPEGAPFHAGTYYPPEDRGNMPGFPRVLLAVAQAYRERRAEVLNSAGEIRDYLDRQSRQRFGAKALDSAILDSAFTALRQGFDGRNGGYGGAPKFPQPMNLEFLLRTFRRTGDPRALAMVELTLERMAHGGIYDQLGGGFHRYSVDAIWLVPHFEKMLYDNSQLASIYLQTYQVTGKPLYRRICEETLDYVLREMTTPEGGFYATQDADSEGEEGKFFVWSPDEIRQVLGEHDAAAFEAYYGVQPGGNFEGRTILSVVRPADQVAARLRMPIGDLEAALTRGRKALFEHRETRIKPGRDEKVLTAWNGLMLGAFAQAGTLLERRDYLQAAERNAEFVLGTLRQDQRLLRTFKDGRARLNGYLEDYACYAAGLIDLYEGTLDPRWYREVLALARTMVDQFWDSGEGFFFDTGRDHEALVSRPRDIYDNATPSGNSMATELLLRLSTLSGEQRFRDIAETVLRSLGEALGRHPSGLGRLLSALDFALAPSQEVALIGDPDGADTQALLRVVRQAYRPNTVVALARDESDPFAAELPLLADRPRLDGKATAYVCEHYRCQAPTTDPAALGRQLNPA
jgi:uncharacterized protein YyaL (SSP411 family)